MSLQAPEYIQWACEAVSGNEANIPERITFCSGGLNTVTHFNVVFILRLSYTILY